MRPYPDEILRALQGGVVAHFAPELDSTYAKAQFAFSLLLFSVVARDYDTAVPDLIESNRKLRELLGEARVRLLEVDDQDAVDLARIIDTLPAATDSLKLSDLRAEDVALRDALARLAMIVEPAADDPRLASLQDVRTRVIEHITGDAKRRIVPILTV